MFHWILLSTEFPHSSNVCHSMSQIFSSWLFKLTAAKTILFGIWQCQPAILLTVYIAICPFEVS